MSVFASSKNWHDVNFYVINKPLILNNRLLFLLFFFLLLFFREFKGAGRFRGGQKSHVTSVLPSCSHYSCITATALSNFLVYNLFFSILQLRHCISSLFLKSFSFLIIPRYHTWQRAKPETSHFWLCQWISTFCTSNINFSDYLNLKWKGAI